MNSSNLARFMLVVPKSVDKRAVIRNTLKRRAREWIRKNKHLMPARLNLIIYFKKEAKNATRKEFYKELEALLRSLA